MEKATKIKEIIDVFSTMPLKEEEDLNKFRIDTIQYRTGNPKKSPISDIFESCTSPNMQSSCILMGHRGCGKSTELNYLLQIFKEEGYTALSIDCTIESDLLNIDYHDIMLLITESLLKIAEQKNISLNENLMESVLNFFKETINETTKDESDTTSSGIGLGVKIPILSDILDIFANIKKEYRHNIGKRETIKEIINQKSSVWLENITEISSHIISALGFKKPILIFEGLDKLENEDDRAFRIFSNSTLSKLNFPVIYTFPISLRYSSKFQDIVNIFGANIFTLPMIKITNKEDNTPYIDGINILKEIIYKRADESLFEDGATDLLIRKTGGTIRDVFTCIVLAARYARRGDQSIILKEDIELSLMELKTQLKTPLITGDYAKLWEIHLNKEDNEDKSLMLNYLRHHFVLEYNGYGWCDVHPLILDFIKERLKARPKLMKNKR